MFGLKRKIPSGREVHAQWRQTFQSLQNQRYRRYSIGQLISLAGTWMQNVAISWVVYKLTGSALALGLVQFASNLPLLLFTYFGGVIADRFNPRRVILTTQWLEMLQALLLTVLALTGHLTVGWLVGMAIFLGCCTAIESPCRQALLPQLVGKSELTNAIGLNSAIFNVSRLIGPMLAGLVIALGGEVVCFMANAFSYIAAIVTLIKIKTDDEESALRLTASGGVGADNSTAALRHWIMQPPIRNVILLVACTSGFGFQFSVLLPVIAVQVLGDVSGAYVGFLSAAMGVGALFGSLLVANEHGDIPRLIRRTGIAALTLSGGILLLAGAKGLVSDMVALGFGGSLGIALLVLTLVAMSICGFAISVQLGGSNSQLQLQVPAHLRGRVMSIYSTFMMGLLPFSSLIAGWVAQQYGLLVALALSGAVMGVASLAYLFQSHQK